MYVIVLLYDALGFGRFRRQKRESDSERFEIVYFFRLNFNLAQEHLELDKCHLSRIWESREDQFISAAPEVFPLTMKSFISIRQMSARQALPEAFHLCWQLSFINYRNSSLLASNHKMHFHFPTLSTLSKLRRHRTIAYNHFIAASPAHVASHQNNTFSLFIFLYPNT